MNARVVMEFISNESCNVIIYMSMNFSNYEGSAKSSIGIFAKVIVIRNACFTLSGSLHVALRTIYEILTLTV